MSFKLFLVLALVLVVKEASAKSSSAEGSKPHILFVLVDDLGFGNIGFRAGKSDHPKATIKEEVVTPNIDALAEDGLILDRAYTFCYCSPSRSSLQTGRLPVHVVVSNDEPIAFNPKDPVGGYSGAPPNMTGIAEKMKGAGYRTHMTGKWDVGMATYEQTPMGKGFDSFYGYFHHANDYYTQTLGGTSTGTVDICYKKGSPIVDLWDHDGPAIGQNGTKYEEELFTENSLNVIRNHDPTEPLFLFHSFHLIHTPLQVPKAYEDKFTFLEDKNRRLYAAMVHFMDDQLGMIVDAFKEKGMWDNTLMVLSSDNGGPLYGVPNFVHPDKSVYGGANNIPLKGSKLVDFEGGIRVNSFVSGGFLPEHRRGKILDKFVHITDWYSTLCHLAGVDPTDHKSEQFGLPPIDSLNLWDNIVDESSGPVREEIHISKMTLIKGKFKVITGSDVAMLLTTLPKALNPEHLVLFNGYWPGYGLQAPLNLMSHFKVCYPACLYNIIDDPTESTDLFHHKEYNELGKSMLDRLNELNKGNFDPDRGVADEASCEIFLDKYKGFYGPFVEDMPSSFLERNQNLRSDLDLDLAQSF